MSCHLSPRIATNYVQVVRSVSPLSRVCTNPVPVTYSPAFQRSPPYQSHRPPVTMMAPTPIPYAPVVTPTMTTRMIRTPRVQHISPPPRRNHVLVPQTVTHIVVPCRNLCQAAPRRGTSRSHSPCRSPCLSPRHCMTPPFTITAPPRGRPGCHSGHATPAVARNVDDKNEDQVANKVESEVYKAVTMEVQRINNQLGMYKMLQCTRVAPYMRAYFDELAAAVKEMAQLARNPFDLIFDTDLRRQYQFLASDLDERLAPFIEKAFFHYDSDDDGVLSTQESYNFFVSFTMLIANNLNPFTEFRIREGLDVMLKLCPFGGDNSKLTRMDTELFELQFATAIAKRKAGVARQQERYLKNKIERNAKAFEAIDVHNDGKLRFTTVKKVLRPISSPEREIFFDSLGFEADESHIVFTLGDGRSYTFSEENKFFISKPNEVREVEREDLGDMRNSDENELWSFRQYV